MCNDVLASLAALQQLFAATHHALLRAASFRNSKYQPEQWHSPKLSWLAAVVLRKRRASSPCHALALSKRLPIRRVSQAQRYGTLALCSVMYALNGASSLGVHRGPGARCCMLCDLHFQSWRTYIHAVGGYCPN